MKKSSPYLSGFILASSAMFASCQKNDVLVPENEVAIENVSPRAGNCVASGFNVTYGDGNKIVFKTEYAPSNGKAIRIQAGVYQGGSITSTINLDIKRAGKTITLYRSGSVTDAVLIVTLNDTKRPVNVVAGNSPDHNFLPTDFEYSNGKLSAMKILLAGSYRTSYFNYQNGDISSIQDETIPGQIPGRVDYEYNMNASAVKQLYLEETRGFSWNTFTLLQYLGCFPELDPVHLRTRTKVFWGNNYQALDAVLVNHQVENGKLVSYEVTSPGSTVSVPHYIEWQCSAGNNEGDE